MSRIFDALQRFENERRANEAANVPNAATPAEVAASAFAAAPAAPEAEAEVPAILAKAEKLDDWTPKGFDIAPVADRHMVAIDEPYSLGAESFRLLSSRLSQIAPAGRRRVLITSTIANEGKTVISTNLALTLAKRPGQRALIIEGDLRSPQVLNSLGLSHKRGLGEWYKSGGSIQDYIFKALRAELFILPAGVEGGDPIEILQSEIFGRAMLALSQQFDWIVIDSSPLIPVADASIWMNHADYALIVARENKTPKHLLTKALKTIDQSKVVGMVLNDITRNKSANSKYYGYKYGYGSRPAQNANEVKV
jgi:capsular exopolysaccharide synthesis family protein